MKFLIILDLNGVLVDRVRGPTDTTPDFMIGKTKCYVRPGARKFLKWLHHHYDVAVWSSMMPHNTMQIVHELWGKRMKDLKFIFTQNQCTENGMMDEKPIFLKELRYVWEIMPWYDKFNTILIDDSSYKSSNNPMYTSYHPTPYSHKTNQGMFEIRSYLERLLKCSQGASVV